MLAELTWQDGVLRTCSGRIMADRITLDDAARAYPSIVIRATGRA